MREYKQLKAIAELDGITGIRIFKWPCGEITCEYPYFCITDGGIIDSSSGIKSYLTSYDAIIPLICKQPQEVQERFLSILMVMLNLNGVTIQCGFKLIGLLKATPAQLVEALLRALGKWIE